MIVQITDTKIQHVKELCPFSDITFAMPRQSGPLPLQLRYGPLSTSVISRPFGALTIVASVGGMALLNPVKAKSVGLSLFRKPANTCQAPKRKNQEIYIAEKGHSKASRSAEFFANRRESNLISSQAAVSVPASNAISCGPVVSPAPYSPMTTSNSGSREAKRSISPCKVCSAS